MKTTFELPDGLLQQLRQRAVREGRTLDDVVADLLAGHMVPAHRPDIENGQPVAKTLPRINARPVQAADARKLTTQEWCDWIKDADMQLEVDCHEKALGRQHVDRTDPCNTPTS
jgi:plasmid stability protein